MKDHKPDTKTLAKVNEAIQRIAVKTGSKIIKNQVAVEFFEDCCDYIFGSTIDGFSTYAVSGMEVHANVKDEELDQLVRVRIEHAMINIIDILEDELELLRNYNPVERKMK